MMFS
ncbi:hypothetical protein D049_4450A, partial [Vibrio parahaemolyticus VPTS-2010]|jgi:hypothetical protein